MVGRKKELLDLCRKFIQDNHITCAETVYQCDWVAENALPFINDVCDIVGYSDGDESEAR